MIWRRKPATQPGQTAWPAVEGRRVPPGQIFVAVEIGCAGCGAPRLVEFGRYTVLGADRRIWQQQWRAGDEAHVVRWSDGPNGADEAHLTCQSCPQRQIQVRRERIEAALDYAERQHGPLGRARIDL